MKRFKVSILGYLVLLSIVGVAVFLYFFPSMLFSLRFLLPIRIESLVMNGSVAKENLLSKTDPIIEVNDSLSYFCSENKIELYFDDKNVFETELKGYLCRNHLGTCVLAYKDYAFFLK